MFEEKVNLVYLLGTIMRDFMEGIGLPLTAILFLLGWVLVKKSTPHEVKKEYV